jgi:GNAT superfamily N-acetyltransferase
MVDGAMGGARIEIRRIDPQDDRTLVAYVAIVNAVTPDSPTSIEDIRWAARTYPGGARFLARLDGRPVGTATTGRIYVHEPSFERYWLSIEVLPDARRCGVGSALWAAASAVAREAGKTGFETHVSEARPDALAFLEHRGFEVIERSKMVRLDLAGLAPPAVAPPPGIVITSLAARPDLAAGVHAVALEAYPDIPSADVPLATGSLEEFLARDVNREGIPADGLPIALDEATGEVVGWASLLFQPGSTTVAWHDMTAVRRAWRGRGVATALRRATVAWAIANGLEALETGNDEENAPMRAVNARLGYRPLPDDLGLRGPLAPEA